MQQQPIAEYPFGDALRNGWRRFFDAARPPYPRRQRRSRRRAANPVGERPPTSSLDPIALTILAMDRLGPARLRTAFHGMPVTVAAPDRETADIFRAALSQTAKARPTDRLISVELVAEPREPRASAVER